MIVSPRAWRGPAKSQVLVTEKIRSPTRFEPPVHAIPQSTQNGWLAAPWTGAPVCTRWYSLYSEEDRFPLVHRGRRLPEYCPEAAPLRRLGHPHWGGEHNFRGRRPPAAPPSSPPPKRGHLSRGSPRTSPTPKMNGGRHPRGECERLLRVGGVQPPRFQIQLI